jgi:hypothetical protein
LMPTDSEEVVRIEIHCVPVVTRFGPLIETALLVGGR